MANDQGFSVILCNTDEAPDEETQYSDVLLQKQVDGLPLVPTGGTDETVEFR